MWLWLQDPEYIRKKWHSEEEPQKHNKKLCSSIYRLPKIHHLASLHFIYFLDMMTRWLFFLGESPRGWRLACRTPPETNIFNYVFMHFLYGIEKGALRYTSGLRFSRVLLSSEFVQLSPTDFLPRREKPHLKRLEGNILQKLIHVFFYGVFFLFYVKRWGLIEDLVMNIRFNKLHILSTLVK